MRILPAAARSRRLLLGGLLLTVSAAQAWSPRPEVQRLLDPVEALLEPVTRAAGWLQEALLGPQPPAATTAPPGLDLEQVERRLGRPAPVPGMAWLEAPVLEVEPEKDRIVILAAEGLALAPGMPVAFGATYLGRLESLDGRRGIVRTWSAANERTGVAWEDFEGRPVRGVALGRGAGGPAVVQWREEEVDLREDAMVWWRPHPGESPELLQAGLRLGRLRPSGRMERGDLLWTLDAVAEAGAEGRVYLAAGAVAERLAGEAPVRQDAASLLLPGDAVFGPGWARFAVAGGSGLKVVSGADGLVLGRVHREAGGMAWVQREVLEDWGDAAILLQEDALLAREEAAEADAVGQWITRGLAGVPRGLWLGEAGAAAEAWPGPFRAWTKRGVEGGP